MFARLDVRVLCKIIKRTVWLFLSVTEHYMTLLGKHLLVPI